VSEKTCTPSGHVSCHSGFTSVVFPQLFQSGSPVWKGPGAFRRGAPLCTTHAAKDRAGCGDYSKRYETVALGMGNTTFRF
jgi:hypothetical protein